LVFFFYFLVEALDTVGPIAFENPVGTPIGSTEYGGKALTDSA